MRVITGTAKGCRLRAVPGDATRPISDLAKESLFNILGDFIVNARILDLFAGTGSVGIEALSRGAAEVIFIDKASAAVRTIHTNLQHTRLADRAVVLHTDAFKYLANPDKLPFDLIFNAPPHHEGLWLKALRAIDACPDWLTQDPKLGGGIVVAQFYPGEYQRVPLSKLVEYDQRKYGSSTLLCFYKLIVE